ncbi:MAG: hypothetical protein ACOYCE_09045 [Limnochordia bacterium]|jgi:hypothetical protein
MWYRRVRLCLWTSIILLLLWGVGQANFGARMQWEEGVLSPILYYGREGSLTLMEAELGRKSQGEWGLLSARLGVEPTDWSLRLIYNEEHISFTDPFRMVTKGVRGEDSYGGVLVGNVGRQKLVGLYLRQFPYPRRLGHLAGTQWEWRGDRLHLGYAGIGQHLERDWYAWMHNAYARALVGKLELGGAMGRVSRDGIDGAKLATLRYPTSWGHVWWTYQHVGEQWRSWANWEDPYRRDRRGSTVGIRWHNDRWGRLLIEAKRLTDLSGAQSDEWTSLDFLGRRILDWRWKVRLEDRNGRHRLETEAYRGPWSCAFVAVQQTDGWDRRVRLRGKILPWLSATIGFQELERRWRLQLDAQVKEWVLRGIGKIRQREDRNRYYYLRAEREFGHRKVFLELGRYDRGRLDAYWVPERTANLGWEISF